MGIALDCVVGSVTNPGATVTALAAAAGDSYSVRAADQQAAVYLENVVRLGAAAGVMEVRSPRMHDVAHGIRLRSPAANSRPLLAWDQEQRLYPQDNLTVAVSGGAAEVDGAALFLYYSDLGGIAARLSNWQSIQGRIVNLVGVEVATTTSATAFAWADTALNATFDNLKADVDYAVLGYETDTEVLAVGIRGPDTGNLRAAGPGTMDRNYTTQWFSRNDRETGRPFIPVINAANKATSFVSVSHSATAAAVVVSLILAELHA